MQDKALYVYPSITSEVLFFEYGDDCIITEKLHGSNISFGVVKSRFVVQSRNKLIHPDGKVEFGVKHILPKLEDKAKRLRKLIQELRGEERDFIVYGEAFGGVNQFSIEYKDEESVRAFGTDKIFFRAFDLFLVDPVNDRTGIFLAYDEAIELFKTVGLPYIPKLTEKDFEDYGEYGNYAHLCRIVESKKGHFSEIVEGFVVRKNEEEKKYKRTIYKVKAVAFNDTGKKQPCEKYKIKNYLVESEILSQILNVGWDLDKLKNAVKKDITAKLSQVLEEDKKVKLRKLEEELDEKITAYFSKEKQIERLERMYSEKFSIK